MFYNPIALLAYGFLFGIGFGIGNLLLSVLISPFMEVDEDD